MAKRHDDPLPEVAVPAAWKPRDEEDAPVVAASDEPGEQVPDPFVGQVVRFLSPDGEVDGTICAIGPDTIELLIHTDEQHYRVSVPATPDEGTWHHQHAGGRTDGSGKRTGPDTGRSRGGGV